MTAGPAADLHDPGGLVAADGAGLLLAAATAGAQVRSVADQLDDRPAGDRPRAFVVVGAAAEADGRLLTALLGDATAPVVAAETLPSWVGPLDTVVVLAAGVDDIAAAEAAVTADRRGARLFVRAAAAGPVAEAAAGALVEPLISVPEALALPARLTLLMTVAARAGLCPMPDVAVAADVLDAMALSYHPSSEFFVNPALTLAEHLSTGSPLFIGTDVVGDALAAHACRSLATLAGKPGAWLTARQAAASPSVFARIAGDRAADVFYDPFDDNATDRICPVLLTGPAPDRASRALAAALGTTLRRAVAVQDDGADEAADRAERAERADERPPPPPGAPGRGAIGRADDAGSPLQEAGRPPLAPHSGAFTAALGLACRLDFAAVYLGLASAARPPLDAPSGLGRPDRVAHHVRPVGLRTDPASGPSAPSVPADPTDSIGPTGAIGTGPTGPADPTGRAERGGPAAEEEPGSWS